MQSCELNFYFVLSIAAEAVIALFRRVPGKKEKIRL